LPELPEVETISRSLSEALVGARGAKVVIKRNDILKPHSMKGSVLSDSRISAVERVGKNIVVRFKSEFSMVVNLGMTGRLVLCDKDANVSAAAAKHMHAKIILSNRGEVHYCDPRRFGSILITKYRDIAMLLGIGKDPFQMRSAELQSILERRTASIKALLLNQKIISGLGNIYIDESLFSAGVHPLTRGSDAASKAGEILAAARKVLKSAIKLGGTTLQDYRKPDGSTGGFQNRLMVYGRQGEPCVRCGETIRKTAVAGRGTHYCPGCQKY